MTEYYWVCSACGTHNESHDSVDELCSYCALSRNGDPVKAKATSKNGDRLAEKIETLKKYLILKVEERDWHAVSDAANDLRVLEGK